MADELDFLSQLRMDMSRIVRLQRAYFQRHGLSLTNTRGSVLSTIDFFGPSTLTRLAALEGVRKPPMSRAIASLEGQGLVRRLPDPSDGRKVVIHLTPSGRKTLARTRHRADEWIIARFARLDEADIAAIRQAANAIHRLAYDGD